MNKRKPGIWRRLKGWWAPDAGLSAELQQGRALLAAIDAGGLPLNPARVNQIARNLGLEVSREAPVAETIGRIRAAVGRGASAHCAQGTLR